MASMPVDAVREAAMSEELSRFWSSMARRFENERAPTSRLHHNALRSSGHDTWDHLVARDTPPNGQYVKEEPQQQQQKEDSFLQDQTLTDSLIHSLGLHDTPLVDNGQVVVDGARIGDVPARYVVEGLRPHELPVVGTYVDPSVVPGFCYQVRPADGTKMLFQGKALRLVAIGMGYGKRITFASESHNHNDNYFWSDTHPAGYGFSVKLVSEGDQFTLKDANGCPVGSAEVVAITAPQTEVSQRVLAGGSVEKRARVSMLCNISYFDGSREADRKAQAVHGVAVALRGKGGRAVAAVKRVLEVSVGGERGFTLLAGADTASRITVVNGAAIQDVPAKYTVTGLQVQEQPVVGTYVDPRIMPGFKYRVRPADSRKPLFQGAALTLVSIGRGYGKRLTFASTSHCHNENYFWSDTHPEGCGFSIQAVAPGDTFRIEDGAGQEVGRAQVFRADLPQQEEGCHVAPDGTVTKRVRVTATCDVTFHGEDDRTLAVTGTAVLERRGRVARVVRIEDVAVGSQMNVLFAHTSTYLTFVRE